MHDRLLFFGTADFSVPTLQALLDHQFNVVGVVTKPDAAAGRSKTLQPPAVKTLAEQHNIPVLQPARLPDAFSRIKDLNAEAGVVISYGKIIPQSIIDLFPSGLINVHASLLPKYRGASPIETAILSGDTEAGVTLMQIDAGMDTGPTYVSKSIALDGSETRPELYDRLSKLGADLLVEKLPDILSGKLTPTAQDASRAVEVAMIQKEAGTIDWTKPAKQIEREIRAYLGWPGSRTTLLGKEIILTRAYVQTPPYTSSIIAGFDQQHPQGQPGDMLRLDNGKLAVVTGHGILTIDRLKPIGKNEMSSADFLRGNSHA